MPGNWEEEQLQKSLSRRVNAGWGAYWVASSRQEAPAVPPIGFTGGIPDPLVLPYRRADHRVRGCAPPRRARRAPLRRPPGRRGLRDWLAQRHSERDGASLTADNFTITNGVSGGIVNVCETFLDEGDVGLSELPTFPGGAGVIRTCWPISSACRSTKTG